MNIRSSASVKQPYSRRIIQALGFTLLGWSALVPAEAQQIYPQRFSPPRFEGKRIPDPSSQGQPWNPPASKLPKFLLNATSILFEQGVADPRGCEYREVEIVNGLIVRAHGFVLPERVDAPGRFVVCWDGLVHPALSVGQPADLEQVIKDLAASLRRTQQPGSRDRVSREFSWGFSSAGQFYFGLGGIDDHSPLKLCMLLRLGRADLAETLFAAGTIWSPGARTRDLTDYQISYLTLAIDWAESAVKTFSAAHVNGDDVVALDMARKLAKFRDLATAKADAMGFARGEQQNIAGAQSDSWFNFLTELDAWLSDQERRAKMPPRGPIPGKGGDAAARIAALIRDLDQINVRIDTRQLDSPGAANPGDSPLVRDLIAEGDPAVAPLLGVLESDDRLTRTVSLVRGLSFPRRIHPVYEAAFAALVGILKTREFDTQRLSGDKPADPAARKDLATAIRQFWQKTRSVPIGEHGFVGHHVIARVPASEIKFEGRLGPWPDLKGSRDAWTELAEPCPTGYEPGRPIVVALRIRNRLGVPQSSPTEFVRPTPDGRSALRKGVSLSLSRLTTREAASGFNKISATEAIEPKQIVHFDPGNESRSLAPLETFEAMRFDLNDWFDLTKPGKYYFRVNFAADSGIGEGSTKDVYFQVGGDEDDRDWVFAPPMSLLWFGLVVTMVIEIVFNQFGNLRRGRVPS